MKILVVEDEKKAAKYLRKGLSENGFVVDVADRGEDGLQLAKTGDYALVILDIMLPERDGWRGCRAEWIRTRHQGGPETLEDTHPLRSRPSMQGDAAAAYGSHAPGICC